MTGLRSFQRRFVRAALQPEVDTAALSLPRGNGKSWLAAYLLTRALTPGDVLHVPASEYLLCAGSIEQARLCFRFVRARPGADRGVPVPRLGDPHRHYAHGEQHSAPGALLEREDGLPADGRYVAALRRRVRSKEAFVHPQRAPRHGDGRRLQRVVGRHRQNAVTGQLPGGDPAVLECVLNKAHLVDRLESLLDAIESAFRDFRGILNRVPLDNGSLALNRVLDGRSRVQPEVFPRRLSVPRRVLCTGQRQGEGSRWARCHACRPEPRLRTPGPGGIAAGLTRLLADGRPPSPTCRVYSRVADILGHARVHKALRWVPVAGLRILAGGFFTARGLTVTLSALQGRFRLVG